MQGRGVSIKINRRPAAPQDPDHPRSEVLAEDLEPAAYRRCVHQVKADVLEPGVDDHSEVLRNGDEVIDVCRLGRRRESSEPVAKFVVVVAD